MPRRRLVLIAPPVLHAGGWWGRRVPGKPHLDSLAGFVRDLADVDLVELDGLDDEAAPLDALDAYLGPDTALVGISCWTSLHYLGAAAVARRVRELAPDVPIVVGGHHPSAVPEDFTREGLADWVVQGDGEHVLRQLCTEWPAAPPEPTIVQGASFALCDPANVDWERYARRGQDEERDQRVLWLELSRGCPFRCSFCVEPERGLRWSAYRVEQALDILEGLARTHAPRVVCFSDALFGANRAWTEALVAGIEERDLPMLFWAQTRPDLMTPTLLERLKRCGFKLDFGLDTASPAMIEGMAKSTDTKRYLTRSREILRHADAIGLHHDIYLIFNFPGETPQTANETREFVESIGHHEGAMSGWVSGQSFFILPGTDVYTRMAALRAAHGTEIRHPAWWRETREHHALATDVLPSAEWSGREDERWSFLQWQGNLNNGWLGRYPSDVHLFRYAFHGASSPKREG